MSELRPVAARTRWWATLQWRVQAIWREVAKFGAVGLMALVVDVGLFNLLRFAGPEAQGVLFEKPLTAKIISAAVAITFSYFMNRHWTFADRARTGFAREYVLFFIISGMAMGIALVTLWFSHYILGLQSPLADNISANGVGLALGTLFRFWAYRRFVFPAQEEPVSVSEETSAVPS